MADLFSDGFESGDLTAWDSNVNDGGDLSAHADATLHGSYGGKYVVNDTTLIYVQDNTPSNETRYRCRFYVDPNDYTTSGDAHTTGLCCGRDAGTFVFFLYLYEVSGVYTIKAYIRLDGGGGTYSSAYTITNAPHCIEMDWKASTGAGNNDGFLSLWVDGVLQETIANVDNDTFGIDLMRFGIWAGLQAGDAGTIHLDDFASNNDGSYIGAIHSATMEGTLNVAGALTKTPTKIFTGTLNTVGSLIKKPIKILSGTLNVAGTLVKLIKKTFTGTLNVAGICNKKFCQLMEGTLTVSGTLNKTIHKVLLGTLNVRGILRIFAWSRVLKTVLSWTAIAKGALSWTKIDKPENDWTEEE